MKPATAPSALQVQAVLGPDFQVVEFEASTRTSEDAAAAMLPQTFHAPPLFARDTGDAVELRHALVYERMVGVEDRHY